MRKINLALLGATGSIGRQTLDIIRNFRDKVNLIGFSVHTNVQAISEIQREFDAKYVVITSPEVNYNAEGIKILRGAEGLTELVSLPEVDTVLIATLGTIGIYPTLQALKLNKRVLLANKETLVAFGEFVKKIKTGILIPVDSEHSALFQLLEHRKDETEYIILTASGGPFRDYPMEKLHSVTPEMALKHPTWNMGAKITIDSATLMNKGLEVIEAYYLFGFSPDKIKVVIHPESIIHGMIKLKDNAYLAHMSYPDMRIPIQLALFYPERVANKQLRDIDFFKIGKLQFFPPDLSRFPLLELAYESLKRGLPYPACITAANDIAVFAFLQKRIRFTDIYRVVEYVFDRCERDIKTIEDIEHLMEEVREHAKEFVQRIS